ncbi:hypothetical protein [Streptomyces sp. NPDC006551]|uniref:hypothetical protein n=1 Tax=Streptomyces sp. NPDC006551 TaxID=3157178 RepID=UPI0033B1A11D
MHHSVQTRRKYQPKPAVQLLRRRVGTLRPGLPEGRRPLQRLLLQPLPVPVLGRTVPVEPKSLFW